MWKTLLTLLVLVLSQIAAVEAQTAVTWSGDYFNNLYLSDSPALSREENAIAFDWGTGSPARAVVDDNFSARWGADPYFTAGTYRFYALADDNVRVIVDYQIQIDTFNSPAVGQTVTADVVLNEGVHHIQVDYRERTGNAYVYVSWTNLNDTPDPIGPSFAPPNTSVVQSGLWTAQYFANAALIAPAVLTRTELTPSHNWANGSPSPNIPVDNFSARWTSVQSLPAGTYQLNVRSDDGVRVYINNVPYINEWYSATGNTYTTSVNLSAGQHIFTVEFFEAEELAFLDYSLTPIGSGLPPSAGQGTVVTALRLNVRNAPSVSGTVLMQVRRGETFPVVGRNEDNTWWQINVNGTLGWVYYRFFDVPNPQDIPVTSSATSPTDNQPPVTGYQLTTLATVNVRSDPLMDSAILGQIAPGRTVPIVGRSTTNRWYQVNYRGITGWVNWQFIRLPSGTIVNQIPITG